MLLHALTLFFSFLSLTFLCQGQPTDKTQLIYQYDPITWVENIALRPNGKILPITTTSPLLNELDPATGTLRLMHDFSSHGNAIQGITEVTPDVFAVNVITCTIAANLSCTPGSISSWIVDFCDKKSRHRGPKVRLVLLVPEVGFLNGIAALNDNTVLMAGSFLGGIWSLDIHTGQKKFLFSDNSMNGTATIQTGIKGIRVRPGVLYFTNSAKGTFNYIPINVKTGANTGPHKVIASGLLGPDDFDIDDNNGVAYPCNGAANEILKITLEGGRNQTITKVPGPTSARWKFREIGKTLYISDVGGLLQYVEHNVTLGGAVYRLDL